jgi:hypothetical protein
MNKPVLLLTLSTLALGSLASADPKADKPKPAPKMEAKADTKKMASTAPAELTELSKYLVGTWHCEGMTTPPPGVGKPFASKGNVTWSLTLDGFWLGATSEGEKVPGQPLATVGKGESRITYDRVAKQYVSVGFGNRGTLSTSTSQGFQSDKLTWTGTTTGLIKADIRATVTKKGDKEYQVVGERMVDGKWTAAGDETCKKK